MFSCKVTIAIEKKKANGEQYKGKLESRGKGKFSLHRNRKATPLWGKMNPAFLGSSS